MCFLLNWQTCKLYIYMSFLFSFVHAPVCANCKIISCKLYTYSKKTKTKKKKTKKNDPYFGMGKNTKVMPQNAPLSIFFLGKGRESLRLKPYEKLSLQVRFLTCSPAHTKLDKASRTHLKIAQNVYFFTRILHLSSNRREQNSALIFQLRSQQESSPTT